MAADADLIAFLSARLEEDEAAATSAAFAACLHRNAVPVESVTGDVVAKLCPDCDEQLDAGFNPDMVAMVSGYGHCAGCGGQLAAHATMYRPSIYEGPFYCSPCYELREDMMPPPTSRQV